VNKHTPIPWDWTGATIHTKSGVDDPALRIARVFDESHTDAVKNHEEANANAAFIVQACNAHDELLAACEDFVYAIEGYEKRTGIIQFHPSVDKARAAIAKIRE